jgi:hypothetical protein
MATLARILILSGTGLLLAGVLLWLVARAGFMGLPGDVHVETRNISFYFPIVTCLVLSALATLALWIWQWLSRR